MSQQQSIDANASVIIKPYPLYDQLKANVEKRVEKTIDIKRICTTINNIAQTHTPEETSEHYREISAIILHHDLLSNGGILISQIPYEGKLMVGGKGILHSITNLPPILQQIIAEYIDQYSSK